jgi:hypothetical protein
MVRPLETMSESEPPDEDVPPPVPPPSLGAYSISTQAPRAMQVIAATSQHRALRAMLVFLTIVPPRWG